MPRKRAHVQRRHGRDSEHIGAVTSPGQNGPSVIAGHVDSFTGPAVFFNLKSLNPGDRVTVGLSSGQSVAFQVMLPTK